MNGHFTYLYLTVLLPCYFWMPHKRLQCGCLNINDGGEIGALVPYLRHQTDWQWFSSAAWGCQGLHLGPSACQACVLSLSYGPILTDINHLQNGAKKRSTFLEIFCCCSPSCSVGIQVSKAQAGIKAERQKKTKVSCPAQEGFAVVLGGTHVQ